MKYVLAFAFGAFVTLVGFFAGLQISPVVGNVLLFPFVLSSYFSGTGFGYFPVGLKVALFVFTILFWSAVFFVAVRKYEKQKAEKL